MQGSQAPYPQNVVASAEAGLLGDRGHHARLQAASNRLDRR